VKILHYHRNIRLEKGGVVRFVLDLCAAMAARGHEVMLVSPDIYDAPREWHDRADTLPRALRAPVPRGPLGLWNRLDKGDVAKLVRRAEVVHLHGAWMPTNIQAGRMAERWGVPYLVSPHGMLDDWCTAQSPRRKRVYHALAGRRLFNRAAAVHCTARAELDQAKRWFDNPRTTVVPLLMDLTPFATAPGADDARAAFPPPLEGAPVVLFLSRLHPKKRPEVLIDAVALLRDMSIPCNLLIAGTGDREYAASLERLAAHRGIADRTRFLGMVTGPLKVSLFSMADVFALPTSQENFGLAVAEAMAAGTPTVTTRGVDIWPELAEGGAVLAEPTAQSFAQSIAQLLADPVLRARKTETARRWAGVALDPERVAARYESLYRWALGPGENSPP